MSKSANKIIIKDAKLLLCSYIKRFVLQYPLIYVIIDPTQAAVTTHSIKQNAQVCRAYLALPPLRGDDICLSKY